MTKVLVIDDEELARYTIREILESNNFEIIEAVNGEDGIKKYHENHIDLIITDIIMPEKEGLETIIELKKENKDLKIIAISGGGRTKNLDFLKLASDFGANKILEKPFSSDKLMSAVNECLD